MDQLVIFIIIVIFLWLGGVTFYLYKTITHYQGLVKGTKSENLTEILDKILDNLKDNKTSTEDLRKKAQELANDGTRHVQKVGVLRFNPFADTGGDQSFVLVILDGSNTGIVLTSLHSRGITRWYAKNVKEGEGVDYQLSEEEKKAIKQAVVLKQKK